MRCNYEVNELEAMVTLEYEDLRTAEAVAAAVSPDNRKIPVGMTVATTRNGNLVTTKIKVEGKIATFIATIDDLLFCVSMAEKTLRLVKNP